MMALHLKTQTGPNSLMKYQQSGSHLLLLWIAFYGLTRRSTLSKRNTLQLGESEANWFDKDRTCSKVLCFTVYLKGFQNYQKLSLFDMLFIQEASQFQLCKKWLL